MKTWTLRDFGYSNLSIDETPVPRPSFRQLLIRTKAVSLNHRDKLIIEGRYPVSISVPLVPASDMAGEVVEIGSGVTLFELGDTVVGTYKQEWLHGIPTVRENSATLGGPLRGVLSEYVLLPEAGTLRYPLYLTPSEASTLPVAALAAWVALFKHGRLRAGEIVLVQGSGGVAISGLQLAVAAGACVFAISRSDERCARLRDLGATHVINSQVNSDWQEEVLSLTAGQGVHHILEVIGGNSVSRSVRASAWGGHIAIIGFLADQATMLSIPALLGKALKIHGVTGGSSEDMRNLFNFMETHRIRPVIDHIYGFEELHRALHHLDKGPFGKIVISLP